MIRAENLSHDYAGVPALRDIGFEIREGEKVTLLGANGCGKSTLMKLLNGLIEPSAGRVVYRGRPLSEAEGDPAFRRELRLNCALLFQNPDAMIFNPTVRDEIAFGPRHFGLTGVETRVRTWSAELRVDGLLDRATHTLSRGEKQRVCLAALLALEPQLLLLDEPTGSLDPRSTGWLVDFIAALDRTVIASTHNLGLAAELGDRSLLLDEDHRLLFDGSVQELREDPDLMRRGNLVHIHDHRHRDTVHRHYHTHDWD